LRLKLKVTLRSRRTGGLMKDASVSFFWREPQVAARFRTAVCLHGHTWHSEENLSFLPRYLHYVPGVSQLVRAYERGPRRVDFARAWWTPPLSPASALGLEREQIARMGLRPIVSLTDHDNIEAGMALQVTSDRRHTPVSVEWTVPYRRAIFHLGIHNLPPDEAREWMGAMSMYTLSADEDLLPGILSELAAIPDVLIVLNHPFWREEGVEPADHLPALDRLLQRCNACFHAFELNGTRGWPENRDVTALAREWSRPVISGGDRHTGEPAACLNLTNAATFAEFAAEIKAGHSTVTFLPQYREPLALRVMEASWDILRPYPEYPGREHWTDRVFYRCEDGVARPVSQIWAGRVPLVIRPVTTLLQFSIRPGLKAAFRYLLSRQDEVRP
jgi:hypothetical protein